MIRNAQEGTSIRIITALGFLVGLFFAGCGAGSVTRQLYADGETVEETSFSHQSLLNDQDDGRKVALERRANAKEISSRQIGWDTSSFKRVPNFGYGASLDPLLGFADYVHAMDPSIISVIRFSIRNIQPAMTIWSLNIQSDHELVILRALPSLGGTSFRKVDSNNLSLEYGLPLEVGNMILHGTGFIVGVRASSAGVRSLPHCDPYPEITIPPVIAKFDPFVVAIAEQIKKIKQEQQRNNGYYYTPSGCSARHESVALRLTGKFHWNVIKQDSNESSEFQAFQINENLSYLTNTQPGFANYGQVSLGKSGHSIPFRAVNFDGADWWKKP